MDVNQLIEDAMADLVAVIRSMELPQRKALLLAGNIISKAVLKASRAGEDPEAAAVETWLDMYQGNPEVTAGVSSYSIPIASGILAAIEAQERAAGEMP